MADLTTPPRVRDLCHELELPLRDLYAWAEEGCIRLIDDGDVLRVDAGDAERLRQGRAS